MERNGGEFGRRLQERRVERGWSQPRAGREIARASKSLGRTIPTVSQSTISHWEQGYHLPSAWLAYAICAAFQVVEPGDLALQDVLTSEVLVDCKEETRRYRLTMLREVAPHSIQDDAVDARQELDWERLAATMRSLRSVDSVVIQDQWLLTRQYHAAMNMLSCRTMLDLLSAHLARLRQLRNMATDDRHRLELGVMICQTAVKAGMLSTGLNDFGVALEAYKYCVSVANEIHDDTLAATGFLMQAQLYGGLLVPRLAASRSRIIELIDASHARSGVGTSHQAQVFLHSTRSGLNAQLRDERSAWRDVEMARRAEAIMPAGADDYFAKTTPEYRAIHESTVTISLGKPERSIEILSDVSERTDARNTLAWVKWTLAAAYASIGEPGLAGPATEEALQLARSTGSTFLVQGVESVAERLALAHGRHPAVLRLTERVRSQN